MGVRLATLSHVQDGLWPTYTQLAHQNSAAPSRCVYFEVIYPCLISMPFPAYINHLIPKTHQNVEMATFRTNDKTVHTDHIMSYSNCDQ